MLMSILKNRWTVAESRASERNVEELWMGFERIQQQKLECYCEYQAWNNLTQSSTNCKEIQGNSCGISTTRRVLWWAAHVIEQKVEPAAASAHWMEVLKGTADFFLTGSLSRECRLLVEKTWRCFFCVSAISTENEKWYCTRPRQTRVLSRATLQYDNSTKKSEK